MLLLLQIMLVHRKMRHANHHDFSALPWRKNTVCHVLSYMQRVFVNLSRLFWRQIWIFFFPCSLELQQSTFVILLTDEIKEVNKVLWLIITLNSLLSCTGLFYALSKHTVPSLLLCSWVPFPSFLPHYFLFIVVSFFPLTHCWQIAVFFSRLCFPVIEVLKQSQKT